MTCIHLGLPKTASSTLKDHLFEKHPQIKYLKKRKWREFVDLVYANDNTKIHALQLLARKSIESAMESSRFAVMPQPRLAYRDHSVPAEHIERVFGPSKIIVVVRNPLHWVESFYFHTLWRHTIRMKQSHPGACGYVELEDYLASLFDSAGKPKSRLRCMMSRGILKTHVSRFGKENVGVFLFEQLGTDPRSFFESISKFIGVDPAEGVRCAENKRSNPRLTLNQVEQIKLIHRSPSLMRFFLSAKRSERRRVMGIRKNVVVKHEKLATIEIPDRWEARIENLVREDCNYLRQEWGLPVREAGYPL